MAYISKINMGGNDYDIRDKVLEQVVTNIKPIVNQGTINNAADEEDLTSENGLLKLKNRSTLDGMGYVILRKNKTFAEQITQANTIYEIRYDFDLNGISATIPSGCSLYFNGGKLFNGTIELNDTQFDGQKKSIGVSVHGTQKELNLDFFVEEQDIIQSVFAIADSVKMSGTYTFSDITISKNIVVNGNGAIINVPNGHSAFLLSTNDFFKISGIRFVIGENSYGIHKYVPNGKNTKHSFDIDRCVFDCVGTGAIGISLDGSREGNIVSCWFDGYGNKDSTGIYRSRAVNTNVVSCQFKNLFYAIHCPGDEEHSAFSCGLNLQSAIILGCTYGVYVREEDSLFINDCMIDYCSNPIYLLSQDGANITNNYISCNTDMDYHHGAAVVIDTITEEQSGSSHHIPNWNIHLLNNTIFNHREDLSQQSCGLRLDINIKMGKIAGNTFKGFVGYGINLHQSITGTGAEKLIITDNYFYPAPTGSELAKKQICAIGDSVFTGNVQILLLRNSIRHADNPNLPLLPSVGRSPVFQNYTVHDNQSLPSKYFETVTIAAGETTARIANKFISTALSVFFPNPVIPVKVGNITSDYINLSIEAQGEPVTIKVEVVSGNDTEVGGLSGKAFG